MTVGSSRIGVAVKHRLQTSVGKRFSRFIVVAAGAVIASQITLTVCLGPVGWTAGRSAVAAWLRGCGRELRPVAVGLGAQRQAQPAEGDACPFWIVAVGTAVVLTLTTKWANQQAIEMGLSHAQRVLFADAAYFVANCVTFLTRFLIFHYILFKDRGTRVTELVSELPAAERPGALNQVSQGGVPSVAARATAVVASEPFAGRGIGRGVNGSSAWSEPARPSARPAGHPSRDDAGLPEPGTRR